MSEWLDAVESAERIRRGEVSARELADQAIDRAEQANGQLNAVIHPLFEQARRAADELDLLPEDQRGALHGVPFLTKDLMCATAGDPYHGGNRALRDADHRAPNDTALATMFGDLGFVNLGRTNTPELGLTVTTEPASHGPTHNPWNLGHSTGGSSGGSAAAVAAGVVPVAHANDGGGSIRVPASECGLFGLKPTRGRVSLAPAGETWSGAAIEGVVSRTVRDSAVVLDGISRPWPGDPYHPAAPDLAFSTATQHAPPPLRIGLQPTSDWGAVHPECVLAVEQTGELLASLGHRVDIAAPSDLFHGDFFDQFRTVLAVSVAQTVDELGRSIGRPLTDDDLERDTAAIARLGRTISGTDYVASVEWFHWYGRSMAQWWTDFDVLVTPTLAEPPPPLGELRDPVIGAQRVRDLLHFTAQFNVTGQPAMSVPLHWTPEGLPVGVHCVGAAESEYLLLQLAAQLETAAPWADRHPPLWVG